jgi:aspartyl-tRNA(Asn)/glutamyl-tRNA(Gln) amidotransferase subunit A
MSADALAALSIHEARRLLRSREVTARELTDACLDRIQRLEPRIRALLAICAESASRQADEADCALASGEDGPLTGIPFICKDVLCTRGIPTTCVLTHARGLHSSIQCNRSRSATAATRGASGQVEHG